MNLPRITIVTPSFNQAKYLPETIESILKQDYPNLEYIIIDGGSTDGSVDIIKKYESSLSYWVSEKDNGQSDAINKGFKGATGVLFNWINSDDVLFPGALHRIAKAYTKNPDADLIAGDHARSNSEGRIFRVSAAPSRMALSPANWVVFGGQQSTFFSAISYKRVGGVREHLNIIMDTDLYYRIYATGGRLAFANGMIGMIRNHPEAKGTTSKRLWKVEEARVLREYGISELSRKIAVLRMRFCRVLDGSYFRSFILLQKWKGKKPWMAYEQNEKSQQNRLHSSG